MRPIVPRSHLVRVLACCAALLVGRATLGAAEYTARVTAPRALVYSGPGEKFYPTSTLAPGDRVEVYREEEGGWLGIRPPQGSFSLVPERVLQMHDGKLAEIRDDDQASRIGSSLSDRNNATQVRLKRGEVVEVLGRINVNGEAWVKIAPPAGEFRWIHAASVERHYEAAATEPTADAEEPANFTADEMAESVAVPADAAPQQESSEQVNEDGSSWRAAVVPAAGETPGNAAPQQELTPPPLAPVAQPAAPATPITPIPDSSAATSASTSAPASAAAASAPPVAIPSAAKANAGDLQRQLTEIELRLSRMASAPPQMWNTEKLQRDTEELLAKAQSQADRDSIKLTMAKIDKFTVLARKYQQPAPPVNGAGATGVPGTAGAGLANAAVPNAGTAGMANIGPGAAQFDAVGVLRPVVSKRPGAPQFALVDDRGQVITFVTPTPDVNLQPYLGHRVGIAGNRGFIPEFNRAHLTAGRVTPLTQGMVR